MPSRLLLEINLDDPPPAAGSSESTSPAAPAEAEGSAPAAPPPKSASERRKEALTAFDIGETDVALEGMKDLLRECLALSEEDCPPATRAVLYRDVGIILADGKGDHEAAVRAMRGALRTNREIGIPDDYRSTKVTAAFDEARRQELGYVPNRPLAPVERTSTAAAAAAAAGQGHLDKPVLLSVTGSLKAGAWFANSVNSEEGLLSLEVAVGHVQKSGLLLGGMVHLDYKWPFDVPSAETGTWGMAGVLGGAFGRSDPKGFHYLFVAPGFLHWPTDGLAGFALHGRYGVSLDGLALGVGLDLLHTQIPFYYGTSIGFTEVLFGINIGYADLLGRRSAGSF